MNFYRMTVSDVVFIQLVLWLGFYLIIAGGAGIITGARWVHQSPIVFHRPAIYILVGGLLLHDFLMMTLGVPITYAVIIPLLLWVIYETIHPFIVASVGITGTRPETIEDDLQHAFSELNVRYRGTYPSYDLLDENAQVRVKYLKGMEEGQLTISPASKRYLLTKILEIVDKKSNSEEQATASHAFILDLLVGFVLIIFAAWQISMKMYPQTPS